MTFIASVIARDGVAIVADSLVTSTRPVLEYDNFVNHLKSKTSKPNEEVKLDAKELIGLFKPIPSHTKDYEVKLFEYDKYLAITTAGAASINGKKISEVIESIRKKHHTRGYGAKKIETKIKDFRVFLTEEAKEHLKKHHSIGKTSFIFSHYDKKTKKVIIYKVWINNSSEKKLENKDYQLVDFLKSPNYEKVVCDGQNSITEGILYGYIDKIFYLVPLVAKKVASDFKIDQGKLTQEYIEKIRDGFISETTISNIKMFKLTELSLQQAVDLANLLMTVEIDFQKYTENIPLVGGVIKIAIINENGFRFIAGNEIEKPNNV